MSTQPTAVAAPVVAPRDPSSGKWSPSGAAHVAALRLASADAILRESLETLDVDAVTIAIRTGGEERLLVCTRNGDVREAHGSVSLGLILSGPNRLTGGVGLLQAVEGRSLFGFTPNCYLGAPFARTRHGATGGMAAWSQRPRSWTTPDGTFLRRLAARCESILEADAVS